MLERNWNKRYPQGRTAFPLLSLLFSLLLFHSSVLFSSFSYGFILFPIVLHPGKLFLCLRNGTMVSYLFPRRRGILWRWIFNLYLRPASRNQRAKRIGLADRAYPGSILPRWSSPQNYSTESSQVHNGDYVSQARCSANSYLSLAQYCERVPSNIVNTYTRTAAYTRTIQYPLR